MQYFVLIVSKDMVMTQHSVGLNFISHVFSSTVPSYVNHLGVWIDLNKIQSSKNKCTMLFLMLSGRSYLNIRKQYSPLRKTRSYRYIATFDEVALFTTTALRVQLIRKDVIQVWMFPLIPYQSSVKVCCEALYQINAFVKSSEIRSVCMLCNWSRFRTK